MMYMGLRLWLTILFIFCVFSCVSDSKNFEKKYFDLNGYIQKQVLALKIVRVRKTWAIDNSKETKILDKLNWEKEFSLFRQADLNKKAFLNSYEIIDKASIMTYQLKDGEDLPVKRLTVHYNDKKELIRIEVTQNTKNYLYEARTKLNIHAKSGIIDKYEVKKVQKVIFGKTKITQIESEILN
jgi:hypothetical protein